MKSQNVMLLVPKLVKISRQQQQSIKPSAELFWACSPAQLHKFTCLAFEDAVRSKWSHVYVAAVLNCIKMQFYFLVLPIQPQLSSPSLEEDSSRPVIIESWIRHNCRDFKLQVLSHLSNWNEYSCIIIGIPSFCSVVFHAWLRPA